MSIHLCWSSRNFQTSDVDRITSVNDTLDVFDVDRANACIPFVSLASCLYLVRSHRYCGVTALLREHPRPGRATSPTCTTAVLLTSITPIPPSIHQSPTICTPSSSPSPSPPISRLACSSSTIGSSASMSQPANVAKCIASEW